MILNYILIALFVIAVIAFILSFFQADHYHLLQEELEQFSMQQMQENYMFKKKIQLIEEELLLSESGFGTKPAAKKEHYSVNEILKNQVLALARQGATVEQISHQSSLSQNEVQNILASHGMRGRH